MNRPLLRSALRRAFEDDQDDLPHGAGRLAGATGTVTRDATGFKSATVMAYDQYNLPAMIAALEDQTGEGRTN